MTAPIAAHNGSNDLDPLQALSGASKPFTREQLKALYRALGQTLLARFTGWRIGVITNEAPLAEATGLPFSAPSAPVSHGGLRVQLFLTGPIA